VSEKNLRNIVEVGKMTKKLIKINKEDLNFLIESLNTYRYAYLGLRTLNDEMFDNNEIKYFDKVTMTLFKNKLKTRN